MANVKKTKRKKSLMVSEQVSQRAELWRTTLIYNRISSMLRESEKWFRIAEIRDPKTEKAQVLKKLLSTKNDLSKKMNKLRNSVKGSISPDRVLISDDPTRRDSGPTREELIEAILRGIGHPSFDWVLRPIDGHPRYSVMEKPPWPRPTAGCETTSTLIVPSPPETVDILVPFVSTTESNRNFVLLETEDYYGVSFADMYIDVGDADIWMDDSFEVRSVFTFTSPKAPCDGKYSYYLDGRWVWSPYIEADFGEITVCITFWITDEQDPGDPLYYYDQKWFLRSDIPYSQWVYNRNVAEPPNQNSMTIRKDEKAVVTITVGVKMYVGGGRASFSRNGEEPIGHFIFRKPLGSNSPGIIFTFEPSE